MKENQCQALLLDFVRRLKEGGSWCGETHIQKSTYFLQEFAKVPLDLNYIFYKHGPYSFELNDRLTALQGNGWVEVRSHPPYGPHRHASATAAEYLKRFSKTLASFEAAMDFVVRKLASKNVAELERLSTALYLRMEMPEAAEGARAGEMNRLKPHVSRQEALEALREVESYERERIAIMSE